MPPSPRNPRQRRDEDEPHRSSRHDDSRQHSRRSVSPQASPQRRARRHRSPHRKHGSSHRVRAPAPTNVELPFSARPLTRGDFSAFEPLFAEYLDVQKQKDIASMDEREIRGRWKSFMGRWNRNELAEGWYDPEMYQLALERAPASALDDGIDDDDDDDDEDDDEDEDAYGPILPGAGSRKVHKVGADVPSLQDLALRDEMLEQARETEREGLRAARKADRALQKERLEELVPRAEAGTRERKLEKRKETNEKMRQFRDKSPGAEVGERDLMGGGDSLEEYKSAKQRDRKRKSDRDIRREEMARARREEIEGRRRAWQQREDKTVSMLKELAKQRFG